MDYYEDITKKEEKSYHIKLTHDKKMCEFCDNEMSYKINEDKTFINWECTCGNFINQEI